MRHIPARGRKPCPVPVARENATGCVTSPRGDGNTSTISLPGSKHHDASHPREGTETRFPPARCRPRLMRHIPARGRKHTFSIFHNWTFGCVTSPQGDGNRLCVRPGNTFSCDASHPREGTETFHRAPSFPYRSGCVTSPPGDGNPSQVRAAVPISGCVTSPPGDGNSDQLGQFLTNHDASHPRQGTET